MTRDVNSCVGLHSPDELEHPRFRWLSVFTSFTPRDIGHPYFERSSAALAAPSLWPAPLGVNPRGPRWRAAAAATAIDTGARCLLIERSEIGSHRNGWRADCIHRQRAV